MLNSIREYGIPTNQSRNFLGKSTHLSDLISGIGISLSKKYVLCQFQMYYLKRYLYLGPILKNRRQKEFSTSTRIIVESEGKDSKIPYRNDGIVVDKYRHKSKFLKKLKEFRVDHNVTYIGISHKIHNYLHRLEGLYNFIVRTYLYELRKVRIPRYIQYLKEKRSIKRNG